MKNFVYHADKNNRVDIYEVVKLENFYKQRIEKAIKRIEYTNFKQVENPQKLFGYLNELLQILKGEDK